MSARPVHLAVSESYTGNECRTAWDNVQFPEGPDRLTVELDEVTCQTCKDSLVKRGICPCCGEGRFLTWGTHPNNNSGVVDGRLTMNDIKTIFYLACDYCSETLIPQVDADVVAAALTTKGWRP